MAPAAQAASTPMPAHGLMPCAGVKPWPGRMSLPASNRPEHRDRARYHHQAGEDGGLGGQHGGPPRHRGQGEGTGSQMASHLVIACR
jgi:hypothetical protein